MDAVFRALADKSRRQLLDRLHNKNGQSLGELCEGLAMSRQAVTKHLMLLEAANLVAVRREGREKLHYLNPVPISDIAERWIGKFERGRLRAPGDLKSVGGETQQIHLPLVGRSKFAKQISGGGGCRRIGRPPTRRARFAARVDLPSRGR